MGIPPLGKINIVVVVVIHYRQCSRTGENSFVQQMSLEVVEPASKGDKQPGQVNSKGTFQLSE